MRNLVVFFAKYHVYILFFVLEVSAFTFVVTHHKNGGRFLHSAQKVTGAISSQISEVISYYRLREINRELNVQNTILANKSLLALRLDTAVFHAQTDTVYKQQYVYIAANVVKNSTSNPRNFITLDKGKAQGMEIDMAVISATGVVGVVVAVSNDYSLVISLLNQDYNLSGMVKTKRYLGSVRWPGDSPYEVVMDGIPGHAKMAVGDTIVSSGYSAIFPTGMMVGTIRDVHKPSGSNFYDIRIQLSTDFTTLGPVMAVKNLLKDQQLDLEEVSQ